MLLDALVQSNSISGKEKLDRISRFNLIISNVKSAGKSRSDIMKTKKGRSAGKSSKGKKTVKAKGKQTDNQYIEEYNSGNLAGDYMDKPTREGNGRPENIHESESYKENSRNQYPEVNGPPSKTLKKRPGSAQRG